MSKGQKTKTISISLATDNPLESRIAQAIEDRRHIQIADVLYVAGPDLLKALAIKGLVMIEREFPHQFETHKTEALEKPTPIKKKQPVHERTDKSALDMWGGATT
ncbi:MAG TPA: hypothetical protein VE954_37380 [Oligoflexus sp.]|uniref:hypothetical protein n=1 Tax=Oligoflexus sp. TaxID=1971216 RepID=UPI002D71E6E2|nr:hypothetical protein [Oligoflexus sp.]HYX38813.1 hypothetical protein [Oligoflexus sp.]